MDFSRIAVSSSLPRQMIATVPLSTGRIGVSSLHLWKRQMMSVPFLRRESTLFPKLLSHPSGQDGFSESDLDAQPLSDERDLENGTGGLGPVGKTKLFNKLVSLTGEYLDRELKNGSVSLTDSNLAQCALRLSYKGNYERALEVYEWMEKHNMKFSPLVRANYVDLICKRRGLAAAQAFIKVDPHFDATDPHFDATHLRRMKNHPYSEMKKGYLRLARPHTP